MVVICKDNEIRKTIYRAYPTQHVIDWMKTHNNIIYNNTPFYFEAIDDSQIKLAKINYAPSVSLIYSFDKKIWNDFDNSIGVSVPANSKLYLKAKTSNDACASSSSDYNYFEISGRVNVCGNILSLLQNSEFWKITSYKTNNTFYGLFSACNTIIHSNQLFLPKFVFSHCYEYMFQYCYQLLDTPKLPATILSYNCYRGMFANCTSLKEVPELPATTLATSCYDSMFFRCQQITKAPKLPATTLTDICYNYMFYGCISLKEIPELPATKLSKWCYQRMFHECTSLSGSISLYITDVATQCLNSMFGSCESITELHYPKALQDNTTFNSMSGVPWFGAVNATVYFDL